MKLKRTLAVVLSALMIASTGSVAFAIPSTEDVKIDVNGGYYAYDKDAQKLVWVGNNAGDAFAPGDTIYIPLDNQQLANAGITNTQVKRYNAYGTWIVGGSNVDTIKLDYRKADNLVTSGTTTYNYVVSGMKPTQFTLGGQNYGFSNLNGTYTGTVSAADSLGKFTTASVTAQNTMVANIKARYINSGTASQTGSYTMNKPTIGSPGSEMQQILNALKPNYSSSVSEADVRAQMTADINAKTLTVMKTNVVLDAMVKTVKDGKFPDLSSTGPITDIVVNEFTDPNYTSLNGTYKGSYAEKCAQWENNVQDVREKLAPNYVAARTTLRNNASTDFVTNNVQFTYTVTGLPGDLSTLNKVYTSTRDAADAKAQYDNALTIAVTDLVTKQYNAALNAATKKATAIPSTNTGYSWFVAIETKQSSTTKVIDLVGEVDVAKTSSAAKNYDGFSLDVSLTNGEYGGGGAVSGSIDIDQQSGSVVSFDRDAGDVDINWGDGLATYEVNASNQGDLNLSYNTKYNSDFANKYNYANIDFLSFPAKPSFNRNGTMYIYADKDTYLYEVGENGAKELNAKYDDTYGAWRFTTRTLSSYAISDRKLTIATSSTSSSNPSSTPSSGSSSNTGSGGITGGGSGMKPNPDTGR